MLLLALALFLVPLLDQAIKELLERRLGARVIRLGVLGSVRLVKARSGWQNRAFGPRLA